MPPSWGRSDAGFDASGLLGVAVGCLRFRFAVKERSPDSLELMVGHECTMLEIDGLPSEAENLAEVIDKILWLRKHYHFGPAKIAMYLARYHDVTISTGCGGS